MRSILTLSLFLALLALTACGAGGQPAEEPSAYAANPWVDCASLEEAADLAGFSLAVPDRIEGYPNVFLQAVENDMIQVFYCTKDPGAEGGSRVLIRKGVGTEDISGDYGQYAEEETVGMHGVDVSVKGEDGLVHTAIWTQAGYAYSISADDGLSRETVEGLVELVK